MTRGEKLLIISLSFTIIGSLIHFIILVNSVIFRKAPTIWIAVILSVVGIAGLIFLIVYRGVKILSSNHPKRIFYLPLWIVPVCFLGTIISSFYYYFYGYLAQETFWFSNMLSAFAESTAIFCITGYITVFILYFFNRSKQVYGELGSAMAREGVVQRSYFIPRVIMWFLGLGSIIIGVWSIVSGPEECSSFAEAGLAYAILGYLSVFIFIVSLPFYILIKLKRRSLTRIANFSTTILIIVNLLVIAYIYLIGYVPETRCPKRLNYQESQEANLES